MKELPKVFANSIDNNIKNTQEVFYGSDRTPKKEYDSLTILRKINNIFASTSHVYKSKVEITFKDEVKEKVIVGKTTTHLITIDGELVRIIDILDIEKI